MKVAIGYRPRPEPWGGGNRFVAALIEALGEAGHAVVHDLGHDDLDIVLMVDPRTRSPGVTFGPGAILRHLWLRDPRPIVVQRINECDERKNTRHMNRLLRRANYCADHTVFVGSWLRDLAVWRDAAGRTSSVILNGADTELFHARGHVPWDGSGPLRLVTHHWGGNWMKGFDIYQRVDAMLAEPAWRERIAFTYVGNLPPGFRFHHARYLEPLAGPDLAAELRRHHVYLTASINEPGGNHQNEGALCGLPLLYRDSGCLPEYCAGFGEMFTPETFEAVLQRMIDGYAAHAARMADYPHRAEWTAAQYIALFESLLSRREAIVADRRLWAEPAVFLRNQLPI